MTSANNQNKWLSSTHSSHLVPSPLESLGHLGVVRGGGLHRKLKIISAVIPFGNVCLPQNNFSLNYIKYEWEWKVTVRIQKPLFMSRLKIITLVIIIRGCDESWREREDKQMNISTAKTSQMWELWIRSLYQSCPCICYRNLKNTPLVPYWYFINNIKNMNLKGRSSTNSTQYKDDQNGDIFCGLAGFLGA